MLLLYEGHSTLTVRGNQSKTPIRATKHLIGTRQRLLQTFARKVSCCLVAIATRLHLDYFPCALTQIKI